MTKLTEAQVRKIKKLLAKGVATHKELAKQFGVHEQTITAVSSGKTWADLEGPKPLNTERIPYSESEIKQVLELRERGVSGKKIADQIGRHYSSVYKILRKHGVSRDTHGRVDEWD